MTATTINWQNLRHEILLKLDIKREFTDLGVDVVGSSANHKGWISCRTFGKQDRNPSAGINVSGETDYHGRYKEFTSLGRSMLLFDFAVEVGKFPNFTDSIKYYAERAGVGMPKGRRPEGPESKVEFRKWNQSLVDNWCRIKTGIRSQAVSIAGAQLAQWPKRNGLFTVISFPFYGDKLIDADPTGYAIYAVTGNALPLPQGDGLPNKMLKVMTLSGSTAGWINRYGLSILPQAEVVWKCEGITDMLAIQSAILSYHEPCKLCGGAVECKTCGSRGKIYPYVKTHAVLTTSGGSMEFPKQAYTNHLAGKKVYVIHDCDKDGMLGAERWQAETAKVASESRVVQLPYEVTENHGKDTRDFLNEGHTYLDLLRLAENASVFSVRSPSSPTLSKPSSPCEIVRVPVTTTADSISVPRSKADESGSLAMERLLCERLQVQVVGEDDDMGVEVFSLRHGKSTTIKNISFFTYEHLIQICGEQVSEFINMNKFIEAPGTYRMQQVKQAFAAIAGYQRASKETKFGLGCWRGLDAAHNKRDAVVVVGGHEGFEWGTKDHSIKRLKQPIWGGMVLDFKNQDTWYDFALLADYLDKAKDPSWCQGVVEQSIALFAHWRWKYHQYTPRVIAGLILASWVQTLWYWRPMVAVTGPSGGGKTTLFECLDHIFGPLALRSAKSTEAGLRQALSNNACVPLMDEFEDSPHRQRVLDLLRTSGKGDQTFRGTSSGDGQAFALRHICWVAAIEVGLKREPDKNRFIQLELKRREGKNQNDMSWMPHSHEMSDMGMKMLAIAIRNIERATVISRALQSHRIEGIHGRIIESYAVPVAMLSTVFGNTEDTARDDLIRVLSEIEFEGVTSEDESELMSAILASQVDLGSAGRPNVSQCLTTPGRYGFVSTTTQKDGLEKSGICVVEARLRDATGIQTVSCLFIDPVVVCRVLLKDTPWRDQAIDQILKRIVGATPARHRIGGRQVTGVRIPMNIVSELFLGDEDTPKDGNAGRNVIDFD